MDDKTSNSNAAPSHRPSIVSRQSSQSGVVYRDRNKFNMWRPSSYLNVVTKNRRSRASNATTDQCDWPEKDAASGKDTAADYTKKVRNKWNWTTLVTVMVVQAKGLPQTADGNSVFCKIRLGAETYKTKSVSQQQPEWREQFQMHIYKDHLLKLSVWDKGKHKNFMGSCVVDLMKLDKERTHELRQELDDGFGEIHLYVTECTIRENPAPATDDADEMDIWQKKKYEWFNVNEILQGDIRVVGELHVRVIAARGLCSKCNAYCTLELDNQRVQTHSSRANSEPVWNKQYVFDVYDVTSTLDVNIRDSSLRSSFRNENLGGVSIPLFRIANGEMGWYGLKDTGKRNQAKGNHPRVLLQMSLVYNPTKAALKLFCPKEVKYLDKPKKIDLNIVYKNTVFVKELFDFLHILNDSYMRLFEWDNLEVSVLTLLGWLVFWYYFKAWTLPLGLLAPFIFHLVCGRNLADKTLETSYRNSDNVNLLNSSERYDQNLKGKLKSLPEIVTSIIANIELIVSLAERMYNLTTFKVPFLSYVTMVLLIVSSFVIYFVPFNYMMMGLGGRAFRDSTLKELERRLSDRGCTNRRSGSWLAAGSTNFSCYTAAEMRVYKFTRKYLNPDRKLNNDVVDFITRIPDSEIWKDWKEISVPEPVLSSYSDSKLNRSFSDTPESDSTDNHTQILYPDI